MKKFSAGDMMAARISQADFGRLVGLSRGRINQLCKAGLIPVDSDGVKVVDALRIFTAWRMARIHYDLDVGEFFERFNGRF